MVVRALPFVLVLVACRTALPTDDGSGANGGGGAIGGQSAVGGSDQGGAAAGGSGGGAPTADCLTLVGEEECLAAGCLYPTATFYPFEEFVCEAGQPTPICTYWEDAGFAAPFIWKRVTAEGWYVIVTGNSAGQGVRGFEVCVESESHEPCDCLATAQ